MNEKKALDSLFRLVHGIKQHMQFEIEALDLDIAPMHVRVIKIIANKPECTSVDIANFLQRDKAQITRIVSHLIKVGYLVKEANPEDKRSQILVLTENGVALAMQIAQLDKRLNEKMTQGIPQSELAQVDAVLTRLADNLTS